MAFTNKLSIDRLGIHVTCPRNDQVTIEQLVDFFPLHYNRIGTKYSVSIHRIIEVLKALRGLDDTNIHTAPQGIQDYYYNEQAQRRHIADLKQNGPRKLGYVNEYLTLMPHQQLAREISEYRDRYAFFYDTRTGKTPLSLTIINDDIQKNPQHKWLVVCPLILIENAWLEDAAKFFTALSVVNCHAATPAKRLKQLSLPANVYITNTESFTKYSEHFASMGFEGCFIDESSDMKSPKSKTSKSLVDFAQAIKRFYLLSGTPAPNGEWEYYMQLCAVDLYSVAQSYTQFKEYFFTNVSFNAQYERLALRPDRKEKLLEVVMEHAIYVDKEDVLTTPGRVFHEVELDLPAKLKMHYNEMKTELALELADTNTTIIAPSAAAKLNKLNQITSGFIMDTKATKDNKMYDEHKTEIYVLDEYRFDKLYDMLDSFGTEQVLVWCNYRKEFEMIKAKLGDRCACVYGAVNLVDKSAAIRAFKDGSVQYLIANPASADKGLTLTNAHIAIYFSLTWSYELFKQSMERIYGDISKQPSPCQYYILMAKGTIDTVLYRDVLQGKGKASYAILNHLKGGLI